METLEKMATSVDAPQKKRVQKKVHLGLQLDMASQPALLQTVASALPQALWHR